MIANKATGNVLAISGTGPDAVVEQQAPAAPSNGDWMVPVNKGQLWRIVATTITQPTVTTTTTLHVSTNPAPIGQPVTLTATIAGGTPVAGSTVTFLDGSAVLGRASLAKGQTVASLTTAAFAAGAHVLRAVYNADAINLGSQSQPLTLNVPAAWRASAVYNTGERVSYQGAIYLASWWTRNQRPGDPNGPWQELAVNGDGVPLWTASRIFNVGDVAVYQGHMYEAKWWTRNQAPGDPYGPWKLVT
jgi:chitodextrinase